MGQHKEALQRAEDWWLQNAPRCEICSEPVAEIDETLCPKHRFEREEN